MPHVTEEIWSHLPDREDAADRRAVARARRALRRRPARARPGPGGSGHLPPERRPRRARRRRPADLRSRRQARPRQRPTATPTPRSSGSARRSRAPRACSPTSGSPRRRPPRSSRPSARSSSATAVSSMRSATSPGAATAWVASLSPWPEEFGLDGMRSLLARLGDPQNAYPAVHVVGTNGKSTATRTIAELLRSEGLRVGAYTSPHVAGWHERLNCDEAGFERAVARVRGAAEELGSTQFEVADRGGVARVRGAGRGRRRSSRRGSADGSTRRTSSTPRSSCSPTSRWSTPRCSARRARRSRRRSSQLLMRQE